MTRGEADGAVDRSGLDPTVVGARIRARRKQLGLTLQNVADAAEVSKSFVSQIEIGKTWPSVGVLEQISAALSTSARAFVADDEVPGPDDSTLDGVGSVPVSDGAVHVVRRSERKRLTYPGGRAALQLLTPDLQRPFEVTLAEENPGEWFDVTRTAAEREEFALVLEGRYEIDVDGEIVELDAGDSVYFTPGGPYRVRVMGTAPARAIWIATPPAF
ncbi:helix-turn-helix domain-containing protein [Phytoactinopolyspora alkaliphila]|uniref:Helix-turn-helix domain-containing protein n=1 Tax=Phytoactinopolyspora alkaliphila TaxID=1783498 RepID=A0A6N9YNN2_9ACTN|nr:XRE family transcriptional regulator [Phytoactinopolyspora alkaliphila]NED96540.1 helix-turn-helix domain-containing protein [Phytoactinopolyspora alkaliphila]